MYINVLETINEPFYKDGKKLSEKQVKVSIDGRTELMGYIDDLSPIYKKVIEGEVIDVSHCLVENFSMGEEFVKFAKSYDTSSDEKYNRVISKKIDTLRAKCAVFVGDIDFSEVTFNGFVNFYYTTFAAKVNFSEARFFGRTIFEGFNFSKDVIFRKTMFLGSVNFDGEVATVEGEIDFSNAAFYGELEFILFKRHKKIIFSKVDFFGDVCFNVICDDKSLVKLDDVTVYGSRSWLDEFLEDDSDVSKTRVTIPPFPNFK